MNQFQQIFDQQKAHFLTDITKSYEWRIDQITRLEKLLSENQAAICEALGKDFKTVYFEQAFEILGLLSTITHTKTELKKWMEPEPTDLKQALKDFNSRVVIDKLKEMGFY